MLAGVGERVKTDRLDALRLARLLRAGELTSVWVPDETHEAMRDLVRPRESAAEDRRHKRQLVSAFVLRHGRVYQRSKPWTMRYRRWLQTLAFDHPAHQIALQEMLQAERNASERLERLERLTGHIEALVPDWTLAPAVNALQALRGVALITARAFGSSQPKHDLRLEIPRPVKRTFIARPLGDRRADFPAIRRLAGAIAV